MNEKYKKYLESAEWASIKNDLYELRGKKCERCGNGNSVQIHHLTYDNIFNEEPKDLIILCARCHMIEHGLIKVKPVKKKIYRKKKLTKGQRKKNDLAKIKLDRIERDHKGGKYTYKGYLHALKAVKFY